MVEVYSGGVAGSRTRVQTGNQYGFYMLILLLIVGMGWQKAADLFLIPLRVRHSPGKGLQTILA